MSNDQTVHFNGEHHSEAPEPKRSYVGSILGAGLLALGSFAVYQNSQLTEVRTEMAASREDVNALRAAAASNGNELKKTLAALNEQLEASQKKTSQTLAQAQATTRRNLVAMGSSVDKKSLERQQELAATLSAEIDKVKEAAQETSGKLTGIGTDVETVKTDVAAAKSELATTIGDLRRVSGDMGVMSGLIATNSKEIQALREMGDRNIYEFSLTRDGGAQRVGDITLALKKADARRNRYTVAVQADDKLIDKKDKTVNEPVQFYVPSKARTPYEVVVNEVGKNTIKGYLSAPKTSVASR